MVAIVEWLLLWDGLGILWLALFATLVCVHVKARRRAALRGVVRRHLTLYVAAKLRRRVLLEMR